MATRRLGEIKRQMNLREEGLEDGVQVVAKANKNRDGTGVKVPEKEA